MFSKSISTLPDHSNNSANDNTECSDSIAIPVVRISITNFFNHLIEIFATELIQNRILV
jgi:hypothetical protein